jgi:hypothetical protein
VELWPQHFVIGRTFKGDKNYCAYKHYGDRNHDELEKSICKCLFKMGPELKGKMDLVTPLNHENFLDAEIFMGKSMEGTRRERREG